MWLNIKSTQNASRNGTKNVYEIKQHVRLSIPKNFQHIFHHKMLFRLTVVFIRGKVWKKILTRCHKKYFIVIFCEQKKKCREIWCVILCEIRTSDNTFTWKKGNLNNDVNFLEIFHSIKSIAHPSVPPAQHTKKWSENRLILFTSTHNPLNWSVGLLMELYLLTVFHFYRFDDTLSTSCCN